MYILFCVQTQAHITMKLCSSFQKVTLILLPMLAIVVSPNLARAGSYRVSIDCMDYSSSVEMARCASEAYSIADTKLNSTYQTLTAKLSQTQKNELVKSQTAWIKFRDNECAFRSGYYKGGRLYQLGFFQSKCLTYVTEQRTKDLEGYLNRTWK